MDVVTLIVDAVIVLWVVAVVVGIARAIKARPAHLAPLPEQTRNRFELGWERIAAQLCIAALGMTRNQAARNRVSEGVGSQTEFGNQDEPG